VIGRQLIRSGTSIGANYRAACRGKSTADVIAKLRIVEEETDESAYWMELLIESGLLPEARLSALLQETNEIVAMTVTSIRTLQNRDRDIPINRQSKTCAELSRSIENLK
jgi:four helix bundle protein